MDRRDTDAPLPVLDSALGDRIRHVVDMFDRKKDAARIAGIIPEQLNRWCQAQSEPRFVGVARLAISKGISLQWIATGEPPSGTAKKQNIVNEPETTRSPNPYCTGPAEREVLIAIISGFLAAEGITNSPQIANDIIGAYDQIVENLENNRDSSEMATILSQAITIILDRQQERRADKN